MTIPIHERLKAVRTALKLSQKDFAQTICISQSFYARLEQGIMQLNDRIIELVCYKYGVRKEYLKTGKGEMFVDKPDKQLRQLEQIYNELNGIFQDYLLVQAKELLKVQKRGRE
jgi:transcriptional regulator with XRE-family HTH domain